MTVDNVHNSMAGREATNDNQPLSSRPGLITEREAIATLLRDGFSLAQATEMWRILVEGEREGARARNESHVSGVESS